MSQNPIFDSIEHDVMAGAHAVRGWFDRNPETTAAQAAASTSAAETAATATIEPAPREEPVSKFSDGVHAFADKLASDVHSFAATIEHVDDDAITALTAVKSNPATATGFDLLHELTGFNVDPSYITLGLSVLTEIRDRLKAAATPEPSFTPAGPQVAGQA